MPVSHFSSGSLAICSLALAFSAVPALGQQNVISAKSGLVHYIEGEVAVDGTPVADKAGVFTSVKKDSELTTALGRAEVLLTPGVFLRVGEQSSIRMLGTALADTRVELVSGNAIVESDTPMKDNLVTIFYKDYATTFPKHGLYEFKSEPAQLKVFKGDAVVTAGGQSVTVREGHVMYFTAALAQDKFSSENGDSLYRWARNRSEYVSTANVSAAQSAQGMGYGNGYLGGVGGGNWFYNQSYGMYTYLPYQGTMFSPFGYAYFSPFTVYQVYAPYSGGSSSITTGTTRGSATRGSARSVHATALASSSGSSSSSSSSSGRAAAPALNSASGSFGRGGAMGGGAIGGGGHGK